LGQTSRNEDYSEQGFRRRINNTKAPSTWQPSPIPERRPLLQRARITFFEPIDSTMNGFPGRHAPPAPVWQEHHTNDGRAYYYNSVTKATQWTKPEEMMSPAEVRLFSPI
jgi:pre-mRNA-processing factor 40